MLNSQRHVTTRSNNRENTRSESDYFYKKMNTHDSDIDLLKTEIKKGLSAVLLYENKGEAQITELSVPNIRQYKYIMFETWNYRPASSSTFSTTKSLVDNLNGMVFSLDGAMSVGGNMHIGARKGVIWGDEDRITFDKNTPGMSTIGNNQFVLINDDNWFICYRVWGFKFDNKSSSNSSSSGGGGSGTMNYNELLNLPTLNTTSTTALVSGTEQIRSEINLHKISKTGNYLDLINKPDIPEAQIQSDWNQLDETKVDYIKNKPTGLGGISSPDNSVEFIETVTFQEFETLQNTNSLVPNTIYNIPDSVNSTTNIRYETGTADVDGYANPNIMLKTIQFEKTFNNPPGISLVLKTGNAGNELDNNVKVTYITNTEFQISVQSPSGVFSNGQSRIVYWTAIGY